MPRLGAHLSIAGGLPRAVDRAEASGCEALQIFTKSAGQWRARPLPPDEIALFRRRVRQTGIRPVVAHNSYLIDLAAADPDLRAQSIDALGDELDRAEALGLDGLVMHPGSFTSGTEDGRAPADCRGLARCSVRAGRKNAAPARAHRRSGHEPWPPIRAPRRDHRSARWLAAVGVCLDTCHLLASGYDICSETATTRLSGNLGRSSVLAAQGLPLQRFEEALRKPRGSSRAYRQGLPRARAFRRILNDPRFAKLPMLLETPKLDTPQTAG